MDEASARAVTAVRAIELADRDRAVWSDADRAWASRAAAEIVGERASPDAFLARRAQLALERLGERHPSVPRAIAAFEWRPWIAPLALAAAFVAGVAIDEIGSGGRINILAPPVLGLIAWNLAVYAYLLLRPLASALRGGRASPGPLRALVLRVAGAVPRLPRARGDASLRDALASFAVEWPKLAMPLYAARAARILHLAAAAFAVGAIAGLFLRGLALEYRASWQSTFLDAAQAHRIVSVALAPGAAITGLAVPDVAHVASIRTADPSGGENAARWLYLYAGTLVVLVVVPRLGLALAAGAVERRRASSLGIAPDDAYCRRVLRGFRDGPLSLRVVPYSFTMPESSAEGLRAIAARLFGPRAQVSVAPAVRYGSEDTLPADLPGPQGSLVVALFNATATPEREGHGAFVAALKSLCGSEHECVALVDESAFRDHWPGDDARLRERQSAWRALFAESRIGAAFADLARPDLPAAEAAFERALAGVDAAGR